MSTAERVRTLFREIVGDAVHDALKNIYNVTPDQEAIDAHLRPAVDRMVNVAEVCYGIPEGIVEIRGGVKKYAVDCDDEKAIAVTLSMLNTQENRVALAIIGDSTVTIRALQADVEAKLRKDERDKSAEHPGQMQLAEDPTNAGERENCPACDGTGIAAESEGNEADCPMCGGAGTIERQDVCAVCEGSGIVLEGELMGQPCQQCDGTVDESEDAGPAGDDADGSDAEADEQTYEPVADDIEQPVVEQPARRGRRRAAAAV